MVYSRMKWSTTPQPHTHAHLKCIYASVQTLLMVVRCVHIKLHSFLCGFIALFERRLFRRVMHTCAHTHTRTPTINNAHSIKRIWRTRTCAHMRLLRAHKLANYERITSRDFLVHRTLKHRVCKRHISAACVHGTI